MAARYLDAETLARLAGLQLRVQAVVDGTLAGLHPSPHQGASVEFAEHKEYAPGDDLRHLDWKALGKFDRYYIKRFEDETDLRAYTLLDSSGSMDYGRPLSKLEYGSVLAASLAYFLARQGDQPALMVFGDRLQAYLPPRARSGHLAEVLRTLEGIRAGGGTDLVQAIRRLTEVISGRSLALLVSDLFDAGQDALRLLRHLRARRHHVVLFHLLHPDELEFPFTEVTLFQSMEGEQQLLVDPGGIRKAYLEQMQRFLARTRRDCLEAEIEYHLVTTADPLEQVLVKLLARRRPR
jgi:uncharacterized protein (DUF58 family)